MEIELIIFHNISKYKYVKHGSLLSIIYRKIIISRLEFQIIIVQSFSVFCHLLWKIYLIFHNYSPSLCNVLYELSQKSQIHFIKSLSYRFFFKFYFCDE